jgi:hypothetical protein
LHVERSSAPRPLGEGGALAALDGGAVIRAVDPRVVERALDALSGIARSLADDEGAVAVARALDGAGAHTALLTDRLSPPDPAELLDVLNEEVGSLEEAAERLERLPTLPAYRVLGIGQALDADGNGLLVVAFATATPEEAEAVADAFTAVVEDGVSIVGDRPWSELLSIRSTSLDETTATIVLDTDNPRLGLQAFYAHDTLFATG